MAGERYFLLPFEQFSDKSIRGGRPGFQPKYRSEIGYFYQVIEAPHDCAFALMRLTGYREGQEQLCEEHIAQLLGKPDVEEVDLSGAPLGQGKVNRVRALLKGLPVSRTDSGVALIEDIKACVRAARTVRRG